MLLALVDADLLAYECGFGSQKKVGEEIEAASWDFTQDLLERKISDIVTQAGATDAKFFLTNSGYVNRLKNKQRRRDNEPAKVLVENFRIEAAHQGEEKVYKGQRIQDKPIHYKNIVSHLLNVCGAYVDESGLEADDAISIEHYKHRHDLATIICSRDKDLRQNEGRFYSWEMGYQAEFGPTLITQPGWLHKKPAEKGKKAKITGVGDKFFYYQMLVGDQTDNIKGVHGYGPEFAYKLLSDAVTSRECYELVAEVYVREYKELWKKHMKTQSKLLWMVRELNEDGSPVFWTPPPRGE